MEFDLKRDLILPTALALSLSCTQDPKLPPHLYTTIPVAEANGQPSQEELDSMNSVSIGVAIERDDLRNGIVVVNYPPESLLYFPEVPKYWELHQETPLFQVMMITERIGGRLFRLTAATGDYRNPGRGIMYDYSQYETEVDDLNSGHLFIATIRDRIFVSASLDKKQLPPIRPAKSI